eukprot:gene29428-14693_t
MASQKGTTGTLTKSRMMDAERARSTIHGRQWQQRSTTPGSPSGAQPNASYAKYSNMWRVGGDLSSATFDMWTNRLDLATAPG